MVRKNTSGSIALRRTIVALAIILLVVGYAFFVLEKTKVIDFYKKPVDKNIALASDSRPVNSVDYTPATTSETNEASRIKAEVQVQWDATPTPTSNKIDVSLSAAGQDTKGGSIIVRAIVSTTGGQCKLTISNSNITKEYSAEVANMGTYYGCKGFDVPVSEIPAGSYRLDLSITNNSAIGSATQQIEVTK